MTDNLINQIIEKEPSDWTYLMERTQLFGDIYGNDFYPQNYFIIFGAYLCTLGTLMLPDAILT